MATEETKASIVDRVRAWGSSSLPGMGLATLITALHWRPFQAMPMLLTPLLMFSSYLSVAGFKIDSAGMTAAWSGIYFLLAARRRPAALKNKFSARGAVRATAMGLSAANVIAGTYTYVTGDRKAEEQERKEMDKWGMYSDSE
ncbi:hypothetical protein NEUTE1DRAFT_123307 [Neurospora tetrasperma FGSC 2508]|uniref:Altered inheritance of mitochondria protein 19 n=1 Tax=Neurospora tetrasperma (strain FGSC 2508 / ATCC MYA-4615 / P0657) TaxID=510951 RepID=F8MRJ5_NEUT8|nr:uncharacterized protein NEUTE1DRAFT_123307 [Neurospora tetrasperma FGSC 2508]EGO56896.1 hypothetical protein NEUTE1DRAFT_123307 [Neurospora tetrasperma FGSC 2508]EGZ70201.1 hypothetical protein NEUTE2DRAFT_158703 [Neurospora tetrasperma FGSC 2509]